MQVELDARAVLKHPEADGVLAAEELLVGIDADIEVVVEQIVVGAIRPLAAAQNVVASRNRFTLRRGRLASRLSLGRLRVGRQNSD